MEIQKLDQTPSPLPESPSGEPMTNEEIKATFIEHLGELRSRILRSLFLVIAGWTIGYNIFDIVFAWVLKYLDNSAKATGVEFKLVFGNFAQPFLMRLKVGLLLGLIISAPFIVNQIWGFIAPGLTPKERKSVRAVAPGSFLLFVVGVGFGIGVLPSAFRWFMAYIPPGSALYQDPEIYVMFVAKMLLGFGLAFQLPVVIIFLAKVGLVTPEFLITNWRQATVGISFAAMVLTPSNDVITMIAMAIPMVLLYFLSIGYVSKIAKDKRKEGA